jgi:hypothetical protein
MKAALRLTLTLEGRYGLHVTGLAPRFLLHIAESERVSTLGYATVETPVEPFCEAPYPDIARTSASSSQIP